MNSHKHTNHNCNPTRTDLVDQVMLILLTPRGRPICQADSANPINLKFGRYFVGLENFKEIGPQNTRLQIVCYLFDRETSSTT